MQRKNAQTHTCSQRKLAYFAFCRKVGRGLTSISDLMGNEFSLVWHIHGPAW